MDRVKIRKRYVEEESQQEAFGYHSGWPYFTIGFGTERDYVIENLSLLIASGMGISAALRSVEKGVRNKRFKRMVGEVARLVDSGWPLWKALEATHLFPPRIIGLISSGESSGRLPEHLNLATVQQHKERVFISRIRSAVLYPGIVLGLAIIVGVGSAWFTLPKLVSVLEQATVEPPLITRIIIWLGNFLSTQGYYAVPLAALGLGVVIYFIFVHSRTRIVGERILLHIPGIKNLIQAVELSRFGFVFGALLHAGIPIAQALESVNEGTNFVLYKRFYEHMAVGLTAGESFTSMFESFKGADVYVTPPMQQMIIAGEQSGKLPETLLKIGEIFEEKTESMSKDLSTILEPMVLIVVSILVGLVALGILSPIYSLVSQLGE